MANDLAQPQRVIVNAYNVIAMVYCAASSWLYYQVVGSPFLGLVHLFSLIVIALNYVALQFTGNYRIATHVILFIGTIVVSTQYATGGWRATGYLWTFAYLPYLFFLADKPSARLWVVVLVVVDLVIAWADWTGRIATPYSGVQHTIFYASLGIFLLCMFLFKHAVLTSEATAHRRSQELATANQALQAREDELNQAQRQARLGSWSWTPSTDSTTWSSTMADLYGLSASDPAMTLERFRNFIHPDDRQRFEEVLARTLQSGLPASFDYRIVRRDGSVRVLATNAVALRNAEGKVTRVTGTSQDVTDLRAAEAERQVSVLRLQEIESLREVNRFKSHFINTAAHELSTPLTPIRLQLHTLKATTAEANPERRQHAVDLLERNVMRLGALVQDLLEGARLQSNQLDIERKPLDLRTLVVEAVGNQQAVAKERGVRLELEPGPALWTEGDARRLAQVLDNLLGNAMKFTPAGKAVHVRTKLASGGVAVFVADEGIGLAAESIGKLFQPFSQVHDTLQQTRAGTGLGLYISKGIIEAHGGRMGVESPGLGKGATFWFVLPATSAPT